MIKLRSIELALPDPEAAADFMTRIWGLRVAAQQGGTQYLRGSGSAPYLLALHDAAQPSVRSTTFTCDGDDLARLAKRIEAARLAAAPAVSRDPGGGHGLVVELPEGEVFRFLADAREVPAEPDADVPAQLTHVVFNSADAEATATMAEAALGFRVSDRTRGMVFVRCNQSHHSTAFARAGFTSLNHIAFEMVDMDAVMRGIGRMRDHGIAPAWGPGRHGPGANVFAYYIAPFGAVVEYSTAVEIVADDYRTGAPEDWTWPPGRIDQWGLSDKDLTRLGAAERTFRCRRDWSPQPIDTLSNRTPTP